MRISIIGQAAFGEATFQRLLKEHEVVAVSAPASVAGGRPDPLWQAAETAGIALVPTASLRTDAGLDAWRQAAADLAVMAFVTDILPAAVFAIPARGTIQYHPSLLPLHRGSSAMNWPIIHGERESGLTIFWPDQGVDTGPVLLQKRVSIGPDDTMGSLYFDRLFPMGVEAIAEAAKLVAEGRAPAIPQRHEDATYEPPCRDAHAKIAWHGPAQRVYDHIRGCTPQPGAWTPFEGQPLRISECRLIGEGVPGSPGRVLAVGETTIDIRLNGGVLRVQRVQPAGGKKVGAAEWARSAGVQPGHRFRESQ